MKRKFARTVAMLAACSLWSGCIGGFVYVTGQVVGKL